MAVVERVTGCSSLIDVLDRVLDKGIVIDARVGVSLVGMDFDYRRSACGGGFDLHLSEVRRCSRPNRTGIAPLARHGSEASADDRRDHTTRQPGSGPPGCS
jgi:hypothetical protein